MSDDLEVSGGSVSTNAIKWVGILLMVLGAVAILVPAFAGFTVTIFIGWVLVVGSVFLFASAFSNRSGLGLVVGIIWAVLALIAGLWILINPDKGLKALTLIVMLYFLVSGVFKLGISFGARGTPGIGWLALNGVLSVVIGLIVLADMPEAAEWAIGLLLGIDFIFSGWGLINFASAANRIERSG